MTVSLQDRELVLGWMTLPEASPLELIEAAVASDLRKISIRLKPPLGDPRPAIAEDDTLLREVAAAIRHHGLHLYDMGGLWLSGERPGSWCRPALEAGARLGAEHVVTVITETDACRKAEHFAELCDLAAEYGMRVALEFVIYSQVRTLEEAVVLVRDSGRPNAGVLIDSLHLSRSGGSAQSVLSAPTALVSMVQLCDGKAAAPTTVAGLQAEARRERLDPGDGALPLLDFVRAIPPALPIELEVPNALLSHLSATERVRRLVERTRRLLAEADEHQPAGPKRRAAARG